jgi:hypothetical protein
MWSRSVKLKLAIELQLLKQITSAMATPMKVKLNQVKADLTSYCIVYTSLRRFTVFIDHTKVFVESARKVH